MGRHAFDGDSHSMGFAAAHREGDEDPARMAVIDTGPYLRQEGRHLVARRVSLEMRQAALRSRVEPGRAYPASEISHIQRGRRLRTGSGVTVWISWLMQWVRQPK